MRLVWRLEFLPDDEYLPAPRPLRPRVPFEVGIIGVLLVLCALYGLVFGAMVYVSVQEQILAPHAHTPGLAGLPHFHSPAEWALLVFPALIAWSGAFSSLRYLVRKAVRR
jgi:hypothetical protein